MRTHILIACKLDYQFAYSSTMIVEYTTDDRPLSAEQCSDRENTWLKSAGSEIFVFSKRWRLSLLLFLTFMLLYMHSVNLSLAVVCMVNTPRATTLVTMNDIGDLSDENITIDFVDVVDTVEIQGGVNGSDTLDKLDVTRNISDITDLVMQAGEFLIRDTSAVKQDDGVNVETNDDIHDRSIPHHCRAIRNDQPQDTNGELGWDKTDISMLLSSFFYGNVFTQIPAGRCADRYGGKHIITLSMAIMAACSLVTPICARTSIYLMYAIRIIIGLAAGTLVPVGISMLGSWAPPNERASMLAFSGCGFFVGTIVSYLTSGLLCVYGFDNGWPSIFYIHGGLSFLFIWLWWYEAFSKPSQHPRISRSELEYIRSSIPHSAKKPSRDIPWRRMLTSKALWASISAQFAFNYSFTTILINLPLFMKDVLKFDITENGLYSALPYIFNMISILVSAKAATLLIVNGSIAHLTTRRLFSAFNLIGFAACLVIAGHVTCEFRHMTVVLLCLFSVFSGVCYGGWFANHTEYAGQYSGTVFGITNAGGIVAAILASMAAGMLTPNGLQDEWKIVFYIAAGIDLIGAFVFITWSSVQLQPWAVDDVAVSLIISGGVKERQPLNPITEEVIVVG